MADSNVTRARIKSIYADNKIAFEDVFGDPFGVPDPTDGHYYSLKTRGLIAAMNNNFDEGKATRNAAMPSILDFFCDVDRVVEDVLTQASDRQRFIDTYITQIAIDALTQKQRSDIEQAMGKLFLSRRISPVTRYFKVIRQPGKETRRNLERK